MTEYLYRPVPQRGCICAEWPDRRIIPLGSETADFLDDEFVRVRERNPWLHLVHCRSCGQPWYAAVDTVDDDLYFRRVSRPEATAICGGGRMAGRLRRLRQRVAGSRWHVEPLSEASVEQVSACHLTERSS